MSRLTIVVIAGVFAFLLSTSALAANFEIPMKGIESSARILISVGDAHINVVNVPSGKSLQISLLEAAQDDFIVQNNNGMVEIRNRQSDSFGKSANKKHIIEIRSPSIPLEIHSFEGVITLSGWEKEALLHQQKGKVVSKNGSGNLSIHSQTGDIVVVDHQGRVEVDTYKSNVSVKSLNGDADLENFSGETTVEKSTGGLSIHQGAGSAKILSGTGTLQFDLNRGSLSAQKFQGRVEGVSIEGPVNIVMSSDTDVSVRSQTAKVNVTTGANSGAALNLTTIEGDISVPGNLKINRDGSRKTFRGRLKGSDQKGSVTVRSQEGMILIK